MNENRNLTGIKVPTKKLQPTADVYQPSENLQNLGTKSTSISMNLITIYKLQNAWQRNSFSFSIDRCAQRQSS